MSKRATLVLAVVVLALLAYILKFERSSLTSRELDQREGKVLTAFVREKVERLEIQRKGRKVVLERKSNGEGGFKSWRIMEPWQGEADESEVDHVLGELEWLDARRRLDDISEKDRAQFGLDKPRYRIAFTAGGQTQRLSLGQNDVHGEGVYASVDDKPAAYVVPKTLLEALDHEPGQYRSKEFLGEMVTAWGRKLSIESAGARSELEKKDGRWWVLGESNTYADGKGVEELLRALDDLRAVRFLEGAEAKAASESLAKPARLVQLRIVPDEVREDQKPSLVELRIGAACPAHEGESYASSGTSGTPVCVKDEDLKVFAKASPELRQAQAIGATPSEVESFELSAGTTKLSLKREGEAWKADGQAPDREAVEQWLEDLGTERALAFVPVVPFEERARLTVHLADDKTLAIVLGAPAPDGSVLARRDQEPTLVRYRAALFDLLTPSPRRFASLQLWTHQPSEVQAFSAVTGALQRKLVLADGAWRPAAKAPEVPDSLRVRELLRELVRLRALSFVAERARVEHGFGTPSGSLSLELTPAADAKARTLRLDLGAATLRGAYARLAEGAVYDVPREVVALITELSGGAKAPAPAPTATEAGEEAALDEHADEGDHDDHDHP